jgi:hypothetical protein
LIDFVRACVRPGVRYIANDLQLVSRHFKLSGKAVTASLLAGLVLLLNAMAASPSLHEWFHAGAGHSEHQCAVTLFAHGHMDSATVEVAAAVPVIFVETTPQIVFSVFASTVENLPAGRAPPVLVSSPV